MDSRSDVLLQPRVWGKWLKILHSSNFWATNYNLKVFYLLEQWIFKSAIFSLLPKHFNNSNFHWPNVLSQPIRNQLSYHHGLSNFGVRTSETIYFFFKHCFFFFFFYRFLCGFQHHHPQFFLKEFTCFTKPTRPSHIVLLIFTL